MQKLFAAAVGLTISIGVFAELASVSREALVVGSDVVLVGTLTGISERRADRFIFGTGATVVDEVVAGQIRTAAG